MAGKRFAMIPEDVIRASGAAELNASATRVLQSLWLHADHRTHECHPSWETLMELSGACRSSVAATLNTLERSGFIRRLRRGGGRAASGRGFSNVYQMIIPAIQDTGNLRAGAHVNGSEIGPVKGPESWTVNRPEDWTVKGPETPITRVQNPGPKQTIEQTNINTSYLPTPERLRAEGNSAPANEAGRQEEKITNPVIQRMGLNGPVVAQLASLPTPDAIALFLEAKADRRIKSLGGVLSHRAGNGHQIPPCTPKTLIEAVRAGIVHVVNGADLRRQKLTHDPGGLYAGIGTTETLIVATSDIRKAVIE